jgi:hypothetical protein
MGGDGKNTPIHPVSLKSYWIQKTEVTRRMYSMCLADGICTPPIEPSVGGFVAADTAYYDRPIVGIKYEQARSYCAWMGGRLPTEAEWEYAARGTTGSIYPWGNDEPTCDLLNFNNCVGDVARATNYQMDKSPFGVLGMAGNVREWVSDFFDGNYYQNSPSQNPTGPEKGNYYVVRGGSYISPAEEVSGYARGFLKVKGYEGDLGFRCVVENLVNYAPYCEASQYTQEVQSIQPADRCIPKISQPTNDKKYTRANGCKVDGLVSGGKIVSVVPIYPINLRCEESDDQNFTCTPLGHFRSDGAPPVTACVTCSTGSFVETPSLECPLNYKLVDGQMYCEYIGGAVPDYCPANSTPINENQCVYHQVQAGSCPIGSYFDEGLKACVTVSQVSRNCMAGFKYDFDKSCCEEGISAKYPICRQDEYYSAEYGCVPLPIPEGVESCATSLVFLCR